MSKIDHASFQSYDNTKLPQRVAICRNLTCPSLEEYPQTTTNCPLCNKQTALTMPGSKLFETVTESHRNA